MFVETGRFIADVTEPGYEVVDACDDGNAGAACAAHLARSCPAMWLFSKFGIHQQQAAAHNSHKLAYNRLAACTLIMSDC